MTTYGTTSNPVLGISAGAPRGVQATDVLSLALSQIVLDGDESGGGSANAVRIQGGGSDYFVVDTTNSKAKIGSGALALDVLGTGDVTWSTTGTFALSSATQVDLGADTAAINLGVAGSSEATINLYGNATVSGNLTVQGTTTTVESTTLVVSDNVIKANAQPGSVGDAGFLVELHSDDWDVSILQNGDVASATSTTAVLADSQGASAVDDFYNADIITIHAGTGAGQTRTISDYVGATRTVTVSAAWDVTPDATSDYRIYASAATNRFQGMVYDTSDTFVSTGTWALIESAADPAGTITVGGYGALRVDGLASGTDGGATRDVFFYSGSAGRYVQWDSSAEELFVVGEFRNTGGRIRSARANFSAAPALVGWGLQQDAFTFTDSSTAASGTAAQNFIGALFDAPTVAATNTDVTTTMAATMVITGAPNTGANQTLTAAYALYVAGGTSAFEGTVQANSGLQVTSGNLQSNTLLAYSGNNIALGGTGSAPSVPSQTDAQRNAMTAATGMMIWNTTDSQFQGYNGSAWGTLVTDLSKGGSNAVLTVEQTGGGATGEVDITSAGTGESAVDINSSGGVDIDATTDIYLTGVDIHLDASGEINTNDSMVVNTTVSFSGTAAVAGGTLSQIDGTSTKFQTEFASGDVVVIDGESRVVDAITNDTTMTVTVAFTGAKTAGQAITRPLVDGDLLSINSSGQLQAYGAALTDHVYGVWMGTTTQVCGLVGKQVLVSTDLAALANGDVLYLSTRLGKVTGTAPTTVGDHVIRVGIASDKANDKMVWKDQYMYQV